MNNKGFRSVVFAWLTLLSLGLAHLAFGRRVRNFDELSVHRLNVLEADGKPRLIISDAEHFPGAYFGGKEYRHPNREFGTASRGGVLFFNNDGDEVGGMLFNTGVEDGKRYANSSFLLDQNGQDQIMGLQYSGWNGVHDAGLRVWDRPDQPLLPMVQIGDRAARAATPAEREALMKEFKAEGRRMGGGAERFFAGKQNGDAILKLADKTGKPRMLLQGQRGGHAEHRVPG